MQTVAHSVDNWPGLFKKVNVLKKKATTIKEVRGIILD